MSYFYGTSYYPRRPSYWSYVAVALVSAVIGGLLVTLLAPGLIASRIPQPRDEEAGNPKPPVASSTVLFNTAVTEAAEKVGPSVVAIINKAIVEDWFQRKYLIQQGSGSGVIYTQDGYILTNHHVVKGSAELTVILSDGRSLSAKLVGSDPYSDLAVIKVEATGLPAAQFGDSDAVRVGDLAVAIGNPVGLDFQRTVTAGIISGLNRRVRLDDEETGDEVTLAVMQTDAAINPGNSGGALINAAGQVIGINSAKIQRIGVEGIGFAIPWNTARLVVDELIRTGKFERPIIGVGVWNAPQARSRGIPVDRGLYVAQAFPGKPADRAGIRTGDVIVKVDGEPIETMGDLRLAIQDRKPGDQVDVVVLRNGTEKTIKVTVARPD